MHVEGKFSTILRSKVKQALKCLSLRLPLIQILCDCAVCLPNFLPVSLYVYL